jgi:hypothetical protein
MDNRVSAIERAFVIAKSGQAAAVSEIVAAMKREGYPIGCLAGPVLQKQLKALIREARAARRAAADDGA